MSTNVQVSPSVSKGTSLKWLGPLFAGLLVILIVAVVAIALSTAASPTSQSPVEAGIDASAARWQALSEYYATSSEAARWQALGEQYTTRSAAPAVAPNQEMTAEENHRNLLERYRSGELEYHAPGR